MLEIKKLSVSVEKNKILDNLDLSIGSGEVHAIMGPNGSGKSTIAHTLAGNPNYNVDSGQALFKGKDLFELDPSERSLEGLFLAFQYPIELPGVSNASYLKQIFNILLQIEFVKDNFIPPNLMNLSKGALSQLNIDLSDVGVDKVNLIPYGKRDNTTADDRKDFIPFRFEDSSGNSNVVLGKTAMATATTRQKSVILGYEAMRAATTTNYDVAIGYQALENYLQVKSTWIKIT